MRNAGAPRVARGVSGNPLAAPRALVAATVGLCAACGPFGAVEITTIQVRDPHEVRVVSVEKSDPSVRVDTDSAGAIHLTSRWRQAPRDGTVVDATGTLRVGSGDFGFGATRPRGRITYGDPLAVKFGYEVGEGKHSRHLADVNLSTPWSNVASIHSHSEGDPVTGGVWLGAGVVAELFAAPGFVRSGGFFGRARTSGAGFALPSAIAAGGVILVAEGLFQLLHGCRDNVVYVRPSALH